MALEQRKLSINGTRATIFPKRIFAKFDLQQEANNDKIPTNVTYHPTIEKFREVSEEANLIPVYRELPMGKETPISAFQKLASCEHVYILESAEKGGKFGRYSFLGTEPNLILRCKGKKAEILSPGKCEVITLQNRDPLHLLKDYMGKYKAACDENLPPFYGGAVGYLSYDMVRFFEEVPDNNTDDINLPDLYFILSETVLIFDHINSSLKIVSNAYIEDNPDRAYHKAIEKIERMAKILERNAAHTHEREIETPPKMQSNFSKSDFCQAVKKAKDYIRKGDIFQVVLSQRLNTTLHNSPFAIYQALRRINPSPYMFYLKFGDIHLVGSSPEILVKAIGDDVTVRPIAGTRRRGRNPDEDKKLEKNLLSDEKERAEHLMLVDLGRNDLGRVAKIGTVKVTEFMTVEHYSHVMHIISNVSGKLQSNRDSFDVLRASFPAGTVSGAPKIRAMEIIDELEPARRGPYAGAVGYFSFSGNMDTCITIRTILIKGNEVYVQAGAGIVADSVPEKEYEETMNKAQALLKALSDSRK